MKGSATGESAADHSAGQHDDAPSQRVLHDPLTEAATNTATDPATGDPIDDFLLPDGRFIPAQPERDPLVRRLAGYASLYRLRTWSSVEERNMILDEMTHILTSIEARYGLEELEAVRGQLTARDVRRLRARHRSAVEPSAPELAALRERADAAGLRWHYENRHLWERHRVDEKVERAIARERLAISRWLAGHSLPDDLVETIRLGGHHTSTGVA